jgi:hypothetical protein
MSQIHFIGGEKGGVGKSLLARVLAQHFIDRNLPLVAFDTDRSHGALLRYYAEYAAAMPLEAGDSLDRVIEAAAERPERRVLVDLAAQTQIELLQWLEETGATDVAAQLGVTMNYWHVMDNGRDGTHLLGRWLDGPGGHLPLVLVLNEVRGEKFDLLHASGLLDRAIALGARVLHLRKMPEVPLQKIDAEGASFWAALHPGTSTLKLLDRQRVKLWLQRTGADLDMLGV